MASHVLPATTELFQAWQPERFADFSCATCHGADAQARNYAMPNPSIIALYPTGTVGQVETLNQYLEASTFMYSRLLPAVQTMVGARDFDPATGEGFTCYSCHPHAAEDDPRNRPSGS